MGLGGTVWEGELALPGKELLFVGQFRTGLRRAAVTKERDEQKTKGLRLGGCEGSAETKSDVYSVFGRLLHLMGKVSVR